ncbi:hypothetical protein [Synechococcus phage BUCT-ZZ01]|nr:hypothetical protein [Synechococcus phage BUCT-ZZ01]
MPIKIMPEFRVGLTRAFFDTLTDPANSFYAFIGRTSPWSNEQDPPQVSDSIGQQNATRRDIMAMKRIQFNDVTLGIKRNVWQPGVVYDYYDDAISSDKPTFNGKITLSDSDFFVINRDNDIFKCIWNGGNVPSSVEPIQSGNQTDIIELADGYRWKYMASISDADLERFDTPVAFPVKTAQAARSGVDSLVIVSQGSNYDPENPPTITINGDGTGATGGVTVAEDGRIIDAFIISPGTGYSFATVVISNPGPGTGLNLVALVDNVSAAQSEVQNAAINGALDHIVVESQGDFFIPSDFNKVVIIGDGTGATAEAVIVDGKVTKINITNPGMGYRQAEAYFVGATGQGAILRPIIGPFGGHGFDAADQLYATRVILYVSFEFESSGNDFFTDNDFRQIGIIQNPNIFGTTNLATDSTLNATWIVTLDQDVLVSPDDIFQGAGNDLVRLRLIERRAPGIFAMQSIGYEAPLVGSAINKEGSVTNYTVLDVVPPEVDIYSGDIIYIENRAVVTRSREQIETLRAVLQF